MEFLKSASPIQTGMFSRDFHIGSGLILPLSIPELPFLTLYSLTPGLAGNAVRDYLGIIVRYIPPFRTSGEEQGCSMEASKCQRSGCSPS